MELLTVDYGDFGSDSQPEPGGQSAFLKILLSVDPTLLQGTDLPQRLGDLLIPVFPGVRSAVQAAADTSSVTEMVARLTGGIILDLQRDLCEWPGGHRLSCRSSSSMHSYELYVESIDERVGRFAAQVAVNVVRLMMLQERFDPRVIWLIDLVRHLRRHPRIRLHPKRVAAQLKCSVSSAEWAIQELERYGYASPARSRRFRHRQGGRILIIDDSAQIRDLLSRMLEGMGYDVITAVDGEEGMTLLGWASYRAVFVDLLMPCMDGFTFLKQARQQGATCPLFVVSAYEYRWKPEELRDAGATDFVSKPFSIAEIDAVLRKHLRRKR